jgi:regulator of sirC expression with transglutaminase-like and TPR domain
MGEQPELTHLLRLLGDESPVVQDALAREFYQYGAGLVDDLATLPVPPDAVAIAEIERLVDEERRRVLRAGWEHWLADGETCPAMEQLEWALSLIADFQNGPAEPGALGTALDDLAEQFRLRGGTVDEATLARFLFQEKGLEGDRSNYYHPQNSNLAHVITSRRGLPISLACIYMLVGHRLDFDIGGCNWPNHFYARTVIHHQTMLVDCFNGGRMMDRESFLKLQGPSRDAAESIVDKPAAVEAVVARVLGNLVRAYQHESQEVESRLMLELLHALEGRSGARNQA